MTSIWALQPFEGYGWECTYSQSGPWKASDMLLHLYLLNIHKQERSHIFFLRMNLSNMGKCVSVGENVQIWEIIWHLVGKAEWKLISVNKSLDACRKHWSSICVVLLSLLWNVILENLINKYFPWINLCGTVRRNRAKPALCQFSV